MTKKKVEIVARNFVTGGKTFGEVANVDEKVAKDLVSRGYVKYVSETTKKEENK